MAKDPAFLFYSGDFLTGVSDLTMEERGQFITLLCLQQQKGTLSEKTICLTLGKCSVDVLAKFKKDELGNYYNQRLSDEIAKRSQFVDSRIVNGKKGGRPPKKNNHKDKSSLSKTKPKKNLSENENENEDIIDNLDENSLDLQKSKNLEIETLDPFIAIWDRWVKYRWVQHKFKYKSEDSELTAKKELLKFCGGDPEIATQILDKSIMNGYQGFFELKTTPKTELSKNDKNMESSLRALEVLKEKYKDKV